MILLPSTGYALRALAVLPTDGSYKQAREVAEQLGIPGPFLSKVLKILAKGGFLTSMRGPQGGYCLAKPAHRITVFDVIERMQGTGVLSGCIMGLSVCPWQAQVCALVPVWNEIKDHLRQATAAVTVQDLRRGGMDPGWIPVSRLRPGPRPGPTMDEEP